MHKGETATSDQADLVGTLVVTGGRSYEVGELAFGADGRVYPRSVGEPMLFQFRYEGVAFDAELPADRAAPLVLSACPGVLPYSAETPTGRRAVLTLLKTAAPARGQLFLDRGGRLHLRFADHAPSPRTPVHVMATLVSLLLEVQPYLRLLRACNALRASA